LSAKKSEHQAAEPVVRVAPLGELKVYTVYEHELETLSRGSTGSLFLNFALFLLPIAFTLVVTLSTTLIASDRLFEGFVIVATVTAIAGVVLLLLWWQEHRSSANLVKEIKDRMPPPPAISQAAPASVTAPAGATKLPEAPGAGS
jgi:hypothetical protein